MIEIADVTVKFGGVVALDNVTLEIADDVVGLIGPNGAGKTTLVNAFSGFVRQAGGRISVHGTSLSDLAPHERARWGLARSFQKVQIVPDLSVADHLLAMLDSKGLSRAQCKEAVHHALDFVGIQNISSKMGRSLNPYQRRMTEIAKCLVGAPRLILLDEPGGGLSQAEMQHLRRVIRGIHPEYGAQILLVDHDVDLIRDVCASTAVLDFGKLIAFGNTNAVLEDEVVKTAYLGR
ncbi:ATP-binding cassette domain-containing protein [Cognatishimia sp. SS12]|uniref:ABC transporter ATP-binding protein n=1 Tax=Cognatishimia sp. SS12 TaxID=2979465 RepID=UPI00232FEEEB|nr:ATP-binding cassette domain-containing protein [Cognatishimia sp. SS12]MDC0739569.1 ATP-binding cassette domain-containing protein [Cognatishimia sp. SS12]